MKTLIYKCYLGAIGLLILLQSCASYGIKYDKTQQYWQDQRTDYEQLKSGLEHRMFLIGDAGNAVVPNPTLKLLKSKLRLAGDNSSVLFLGNNIYPGGLPPRVDSLAHSEAERKLLTQLQVLHDFEGMPIFLPGNRDQYYGGVNALRRQENYIESYLSDRIEGNRDSGNYFLPDKGCPGPEVVELTDNVVVIVINSQWWTTDWDGGQPNFNDDCEIKTKNAFSNIFDKILERYRTKNVVISTHHPLYSYGLNEESSPVHLHLFPLTAVNENFYIPLPGLGTLGILATKLIVTRQNLSHPVYDDYRNFLLSTVRKHEQHGSFIFAASHDKSLQHIERDGQIFIVSGAGSESLPVKLGKGSLFSIANQGFTQLDFYEDGSVYATYLIPEEQNPVGKIVFLRQIKGSFPKISKPDLQPLAFPSYQSAPHAINVGIPLGTTAEGKRYKSPMGSHYRDVYARKYTIPVLDMNTYRGGIKPLEIAEEGQKIVLQFQGRRGRQYIMRPIIGEDLNFLPPAFNRSLFAQAWSRDEFLSMHPFASTAIPLMAEACNIFHTDPKFFYVPAQPALQEFNDAFGDNLYLLETFPNDANKNEFQCQYGRGDKVIDTQDLIEKMHEGYDHRPDENWVVRSRLFDWVIGDWYKEDSQWVWAGFEGEDGKTTYLPIPKNRDQAFSNYEGFFTNLLGFILPIFKQLGAYKSNPGSIKWSTYNGRQFDKTFLPGLSWQDWKKQAEFIQQHLTDSIIDEAFMQSWPREIRKHSTAEEIKQILRDRREDLLNTAREYYEHVAKEVEIVGTNERELFEVNRTDDRTTVVKVYELSKRTAKKKQLIYRRAFFADETKEIRLFGLNDDDIFEIKGQVKNGILVRAIGGFGDDTFIDQSKVAGLSKKSKIYDDDETQNIFELGSESRKLTHKGNLLNQYRREENHDKYDFIRLMPKVEINPDDGLLLGGIIQYTNYAYQKGPFAQRYLFTGRYAFATDAYDFEYQGHFLQTFGEWDLQLGALFQSPNYTMNFFGFGNETSNNAKDNFDFNRVRKR